MVFHYPGEEPLGNRWWLGPLRVFTSDDRAAQLTRMGPSIVFNAAVYFTGFTFLVRSVPWAYAVTSRYNKHVGWSQRKATGMLTAGWVVTEYSKLMYAEWSNHLRPAPGPWTPYDFYRAFDTRPTPAELEGERPGAMLVRDEGRWLASPILTVEGGLCRALTTRGLSLIDFLKFQLSVGLEAPLKGNIRTILHYCGAPGYVSNDDRGKLYQALLNTSAACYCCYDKESADYGNFVFEGVNLPSNDTASAEFDRIVAVVDHDKMEVVKVVTTKTRKTDFAVETQTWGSPAHAEENADATKLTEQQSLHQAGLLIAAIAATYSHAHTHWWANGVAAMEPGQWKHQEKSAKLTQFMNAQSIFASWFFFGNSVATANEFLVRNNAHGIPAHGGKALQEYLLSQKHRSTADAGAEISVDEIAMKRHAPGCPSHDVEPTNRVDRACHEQPRDVAPSTVGTPACHYAERHAASVDTPLKELEPLELAHALGARSTYHRLSTAALIDVQAALKEKTDDATRVAPMAMSIVAGSVMHGLDHYMCGELTPIYGNGNCVPLRTDLSGLLMSLVYPIDYWSRRAKVSQNRRNDPVCEALWVATNREAEVIRAENAAAVKAGKKAPLADPGKFMRKYLTVGCNI